MERAGHTSQSNFKSNSIIPCAGIGHASQANLSKPHCNHVQRVSTAHIGNEHFACLLSPGNHRNTMGLRMQQRTLVSLLRNVFQPARSRRAHSFPYPFRVPRSNDIQKFDRTSPRTKSGDAFVKRYERSSDICCTIRDILLVQFHLSDQLGTGLIRQQATSYGTSLQSAHSL